MKALRYLILLFLQAFCFIAFSQKQRIKFEHIGTNSGLSQSNVMSIFQDSRGFMWFGTRDGLASHDLQEPLRTTSSFVELIQEQYKGQLDERADKYLSFIAQSSDRMKVFIKKLLHYSMICRE